MLTPRRLFTSLKAHSSLLPCRSPATLRTLTNTASIMGKQEWIVILPDYPGALEKRMEVRPQHLEAIKPRVQAGTVVLGGASLDEPAKEGSPMKINGSVMMAEADTEQEVREIIESDIYYRTGVWDKEKIRIFPFKSAVRQGL
ncbi:Derivative of benzaldehyde biosynthesis cluster protein C [Fulvia fulva]|uniref:Derivative of benzaldehyde biosynthesis cluster protein C n=1 Tax=Passalora fulva TaxID=5499 RepID=A0A9Q8PKV4_PASFU|nr:Derivative of benzaldehyde biosynthesis cluster protein C [Fulvia fulva]KAK4610071.1 Derivative of benzaldehyde biosynthesis cluster protein C [Fulvia fulva]KAK4611373.1 Derivative of benzaldehyde biosynthesis cluster protein C [Fulvia fulva]UJO24290.1 Derivative of benzaldehyde biosynthesis cluster protein C [Fulvia fulva]WPV22043.1 Derivative of benzaldehyde biosynthesis cluster protein C [Fulvia fulva]WPV36868.1 Derivative of benzaldehyde biosynthesis cluster protein C [Fulvia fulva]